MAYWHRDSLSVSVSYHSCMVMTYLFYLRLVAMSGGGLPFVDHTYLALAFAGEADSYYFFSRTGICIVYRAGWCRWAGRVDQAALATGCGEVPGRRPCR